MRTSVSSRTNFDPILWVEIGSGQMTNTHVIYWTPTLEMQIVPQDLFDAMFPMELDEFMHFRDEKPLLKWIEGEEV